MKMIPKQRNKRKSLANKRKRTLNWNTPTNRAKSSSNLSNNNIMIIIKMVIFSGAVKTGQSSSRPRILTSKKSQITIEIIVTKFRCMAQRQTKSLSIIFFSVLAHLGLNKTDSFLEHQKAEVLKPSCMGPHFNSLVGHHQLCFLKIPKFSQALLALIFHQQLETSLVLYRKGDEGIPGDVIY